MPLRPLLFSRTFFSGFLSIEDGRAAPYDGRRPRLRFPGLVVPLRPDIGVRDVSRGRRGSAGELAGSPSLLRSLEKGCNTSKVPKWQAGTSSLSHTTSGAPFGIKPDFPSRLSLTVQVWKCNAPRVSCREAQHTTLVW